MAEPNPPLGLLPEVWVEIGKFLHLQDFHTLCCLNHELHRFIWSVVIRTLRFGERITNEQLAACLNRINGFGYAQISKIDLFACHDITDTGLAVVASISTLTDLNIAGLTSYTAQGFEALLSLGHLAYLKFTPFPDSLLGMTRLEKLTKLTAELSRAFRGENLAHISGLTTLEHLEITNPVLHRLEAEYIDLSTLSRLKTLKLPQNMEVDFSHFPYLQSVDIPSAQWICFYDHIAVALCRLPLTTLNLSFCDMPENFFSCIEAVTSLTHLNLAYGRYIEDKYMPHLRPLTKLVELDLTKTKIHDEGILEFAELTNLRSLRLGQNPIQGLNPISGLTNLTSLHLNSTPVNFISLPCLKDLTDLSDLNLSRTDCGDSVIADLRKMNLWNFTVLSLGPGLGNAGLYPLRYPEFLGLRSLSFFNCPFSPEGLSHFTNLTSLEKLHFEACFLSLNQKGLEYLTCLTQLQSLSLAMTILPENIYPEMKMLKSLTSLSLSGCYTGDSDLLHLIELYNLKTLHLDTPRMTRKGVRRLRDIPSLVNLHLPGFHCPQGDQDYLTQNNPRLKIVAAASPFASWS